MGDKYLGVRVDPLNLGLTEEGKRRDTNAATNISCSIW